MSLPRTFLLKMVFSQRVAWHNVSLPRDGGFCPPFHMDEQMPGTGTRGRRLSPSAPLTPVCFSCPHIFVSFYFVHVSEGDVSWIFKGIQLGGNLVHIYGTVFLSGTCTCSHPRSHTNIGLFTQRFTYEDQGTQLITIIARVNVKRWATAHYLRLFWTVRSFLALY